MALLDKCPVYEMKPEGDDTKALGAPLVGAAVAVAAPLLADFLVTLAAKGIEANEQGLSGEFMAGTSVANINEAFQNNQQCLVIYRGLFGKTEFEEKIVNKSLKENDLMTLGLVDYPAFYMEATGAIDGNSLTITPRYVSYADTVARNTGSGKKHVGIVLAMTERVLQRNGEPPSDNEALAVFRFDLGQLEVGKSYKEELNSPILRGTGAVQQIDVGDAGQPANLTAYVIESEDPGLVLAAFSKAFEGQKDNLTSALTDLVRDATGTD